LQTVAAPPYPPAPSMPEPNAVRNFHG